MARAEELGKRHHTSWTARSFERKLVGNGPHRAWWKETTSRKGNYVPGRKKKASKKKEQKGEKAQGGHKKKVSPAHRIYHETGLEPNET